MEALKKTDFDVLAMLEEYRLQLLDFYKPFFALEKDLNGFVNLALNFDDNNSSVRFMIQQVHRFVSLANDIEKIRPNRDPLRIFFIKICMESLCKNVNKEQKEFFLIFANCFSEEAKSYITSCFEYTGINLPDSISSNERRMYCEYESHSFCFNDFFMLIKAVRDIVVHEGDYWSMQLFSYDDESIWITSLTTKENIFELEEKLNREVTYNFHTKLNYSRFIYYFVEACIGFIKKAIKGFQET